MVDDCSRVPHSQGVSEPVYEAWTLYLSDTQDYVEKTSFCGLRVTRRFPENQPFVSCTNQPYSQDELSGMTTDAVRDYVKNHKRCLPSRLIRGRRASYEDHLDERILKLPRAVQSELNALLGDREDASSNRFHRRDWTVVVMQEEYHFRFAKAECDQVTKTRRFWNKKEAKRPKQYFFVIRGGEGRVATDDKGIHRARRNGNPWRRVDATERRQKDRARDARHIEKVHADLDREWKAGARDRPVSPPPSPPRRVWVDREDPFDVATPCFNPFVPILESGGPVMQSEGSQPPAPSFYPAPPPSPAPHPSIPGPYACSVPRNSAWLDLPPYHRVGGPHPHPPPHPPIPIGAPRPHLDFTACSMGRDQFQPARQPLAPAQPAQWMPVPHRSLATPHSTLLNFPGGPNNGFYVLPASTGSTRYSPPPAPRLSNLTTPTTFSPATSHHTGSSDDRTEVSTPSNEAMVEVVENPFVWNAEIGPI